MLFFLFSVDKFLRLKITNVYKIKLNIVLLEGVVIKNGKLTHIINIMYFMIITYCILNIFNIIND